MNPAKNTPQTKKQCPVNNEELSGSSRYSPCETSIVEQTRPGEENSESGVSDSECWVAELGLDGRCCS